MIAAQAEIFRTSSFWRKLACVMLAERICVSSSRNSRIDAVDPQQMVVDVAEVGPHLVRYQALQAARRDRRPRERAA